MKKSKFCTAISIPKNKGVAAYAKRWEPGQVLRVGFVGGSEKLQRRVVKTMEQWNEVGANIKLAYSDLPLTEIRVGFTRNYQSWSYVGKDCLDYPEQTMNLGWLYEKTGEEEFNRVVLHEFGHALGLEHEHQNPNVNFRWNKPYIYDYYMKNMGWGRDYVDHNIFNKVDTPDTLATNFDAESIMLYSFPIEFTLDGFSIPWENSKISEGDKAILRLLYPF